MKGNRRTEIVSTIGPASESPEILEDLLLSGVDVFRFSYGRDSLSDNRRRVYLLRKASIKTGCPVKLLMDLPGRKNRIKSQETIWVKAGDQCLLGDSVAVEPSSIPRIRVLFPKVLENVTLGDLIYFGDGEFSARVINRIDRRTILIKIDNSGELAPGRGVTAVTSNLGLGSSLTIRDIHFLKHHVTLGFDSIALSFVNSASDIVELKKCIKALINKQPSVIAKIETMDGVVNLEEILQASDGVMIGRGDLALNIPFEMLPMIQKQIIDRANFHGKKVIVATQMLESTSERQVPLRSEIIDIASAVYQGTSAIMLSGETRTGKRPVYTVQIADRIIRQAEQELQAKS